MKHAHQMSESFEVATLITLSGGLMDAYSFLLRGHVFSNAQTGNLLLLGVNLSTGNWIECIDYILPIICFSFGIGLAQIIRLHWGPTKIHWRQVCLAIEVALLIVVSMIPLSVNLAATTLLSLACGIQVQAFRKVHGFGVATTMCIGNLRSGMQEWVSVLHAETPAGRSKHREAALVFHGTVVVFVIGAIIGNHFLPHLGVHTIWISVALLVCAMCIMIHDREAALMSRDF